MNGWPRLHIVVDIGAVGFRSVGCPGKFHLCSQLALLLQPLLQILLGIGQGPAAIVLPRPDGRSPDPRRDSLQALVILAASSGVVSAIATVPNLARRLRLTMNRTLARLCSVSRFTWGRTSASK